ncbi:MAG: GGDEF domain-containing protein [Alphaproteobacteria bacterium]
MRRSDKQTVFAKVKEITGLTIPRDQQTPRMREVFEELCRQIETDHLTGVANIIALQKKIQRSAQTASQHGNGAQRSEEKATHLSIVFVDANDFGAINKELADDVGDEAIKSIASYFSENLRKDDFVARKGGDEFVILMHCPKEEAIAKMNQLKAGFKESVTKQVRQEVERAFPDDHEQRITAYQNALARKHKNPALARKPFEMSFSFGVSEVSSEQMQQITQGDIKAAVKPLLRQGDEAMRDDKARYREMMNQFGRAASAGQALTSRVGKAHKPSNGSPHR